MQLVDPVFQEESAKHRRVTYVDAWTLFSTPGSPGTYAQYLPNEAARSTTCASTTASTSTSKAANTCRAR